MKDRQGFCGSIAKQKITEESRRICQIMAEFVQSFGLLSTLQPRVIIFGSAHEAEVLMDL